MPTRAPGLSSSPQNLVLLLTLRLRCRELLLLLLAAVCLQLFAQSNWTGPSVSIALSDLLPPAGPTPQV